MTDQSVIMPATSAAPDKRRLILNAVRRLLVEHGYQDVALEHVAREAGVAKGTLFLYYKSKEDLLTAALADLAEQLRESLDALPLCGKQGRALLEETVSVVVGFFEGNSDFMSQISLGRIPGCGHRLSEKLMDRFSANHGRLVRVLKLCAKDGVIKGEDVELAASFLFSLCRGATFYKLMTGRDIGPHMRRQKVLEFFLKGAGR